MIRKEFSMLIKQKREQLGLKQAELASIMNVTQTSIAKWETEQAIPRIDKLIKLAKIFNCTIDELLSKEE